VSAVLLNHWTFYGVSVNSCGKQTTIPVVDKIDLRPGIQCPFDAGAETPIWQNPFGCIRNQDRVADNGITVADFHNVVLRRASLTEPYNPYPVDIACR